MKTKQQFGRFNKVAATISATLSFILVFFLLLPQTKPLALSQVYQALTTPTPTLTATPTLTPTITLTITSTPSPTQTRPSITTLPAILLIICVISSLTFASILGYFLFRKPKRQPRIPKVVVNPTPPTNSHPPLDDLVFIPTNTSTQESVNLSEKLKGGYELLRELYGIASAESNLRFVPIEDLNKLLIQLYPGKEIDLEQIAIEIANTRSGLLKIQHARYKGYLVKILNTEEDQ